MGQVQRSVTKRCETETGKALSQPGHQAAGMDGPARVFPSVPVRSLKTKNQQLGLHVCRVLQLLLAGSGT